MPFRALYAIVLLWVSTVSAQPTAEISRTGIVRDSARIAYAETRSSETARKAEPTFPEKRMYREISPGPESCTGVVICSQAAVVRDGEFFLGKHGEMPSPRPGQNSHHGVMSAWMEKNFPGYNENLAPAVLMPTPNHRATYGVFNTWRAEMKASMGGVFDWTKVSEPQMIKLSEKMFDAAKVPQTIRQGYWDWFTRMKGALTP